MIIIEYYGYSYSTRIQNILEYGINSDFSSASRFFRIRANFIGYKEHFLNALLGYSIGNEMLPIVQGYEEAIKYYDKLYHREIDGLKHYDKGSEHSLAWCLYVKFMNEFGLIISLFFLLLIIKH